MTNLALLDAALSQRGRGLFVAFEGADGSGKTTQLELLQCRLSAPALFTREPGGTSLGRELRRLVMHGPSDVDAKTEALLYAADRAYHANTVIRPALEQGTSVFTDRYIDSSVAYQGLGRGLGEEAIRDLSMWATDGLIPDVVIILDANQEVTSARTGSARDRIEQAGSSFQQKVREHYLATAAQNPDRYRVINAEGMPEQVFGKVVEALTEAAQ